MNSRDRKLRVSKCRERAFANSSIGMHESAFASVSGTVNQLMLPPSTNVPRMQSPAYPTKQGYCGRMMTIM